jgi:hypothetical protein
MRLMGTLRTHHLFSFASLLWQSSGSQRALRPLRRLAQTAAEVPLRKREEVALPRTRGLAFLIPVAKIKPRAVTRSGLLGSSLPELRLF